jgi:hypothetical protein
MAGLVLTAEQIRNAPPVVRKWLSSIVDAEFLLDGRTFDGPYMDESVPCPSTPEEMTAVFVRVRSDFATAHVMLELGRYTPHIADRTREVAGAALAGISRRAGLRDSRQLIACLETIASGLAAVRGRSDARLFAFDEQGHVYFHETTYQSLRHPLAAIGAW